MQAAEYLRGAAKGDDCEPLFKQYKECLSVSFASAVVCCCSVLIRSQKALKERGIDQMLEETRADHKEHDAEYLKPSIRSGCKLLLDASRLPC